MKRGRLRTARKLKRIAESRGYSPSLRLCYRIVAAAQDTGSRVTRLAALVEKESAYQHVFGHDAGGWFPGQRVTRRKYRKLRRHFKEEDWSGANGVSYVQVTYPQFILDDPSLWRPKKNLRWGAEYLESLVARAYTTENLNEYNGDPTGAYGRDLAIRIAAYADSFRALSLNERKP
jgi:hypothetical protein